jgi:hypothetical protein
MPSGSAPGAQAALDAQATRLGSRALFCSSLVSLFANFAFPPFVTEARQCITSLKGRGAEESWWERMCRVPRSLQVHLARQHHRSHGPETGPPTPTQQPQPQWLQQPPNLLPSLPPQNSNEEWLEVVLTPSFKDRCEGHEFERSAACAQQKGCGSTDASTGTNMCSTSTNASSTVQTRPQVPTLPTGQTHLPPTAQRPP